MAAICLGLNKLTSWMAAYGARSSAGIDQGFSASDMLKSIYNYS